jgi:hypothetical protein
MRCSTITEKTKIRRNLSLQFNELDGDILITSPRDSCCYGLGSIGSFIWNMLADPCELTFIIKRLTKEYNVTYSKCLEDVIELIKDMHVRELINIIDEKEMNL